MEELLPHYQLSAYQHAEVQLPGKKLKKISGKFLSTHKARNSECLYLPEWKSSYSHGKESKYSQGFLPQYRGKIRPKCLIEKIFMLNLGEKYVKYIS